MNIFDALDAHHEPQQAVLNCETLTRVINEMKPPRMKDERLEITLVATAVALTYFGGASLNCLTLEQGEQFQSLLAEARANLVRNASPTSVSQEFSACVRLASEEQIPDPIWRPL